MKALGLSDAAIAEIEAMELARSAEKKSTASLVATAVLAVAGLAGIVVAAHLVVAPVALVAAMNVGMIMELCGIGAAAHYGKKYRQQLAAAKTARLKPPTAG
jgi:hypothetical protein